MQIRTATDHEIVRKSGGYRAFVLRAARARWPRVQAVNWTAQGTVAAFVLRSNWVVQCPTCPEALLAEPGEPFWCPNCLNVSNGGQALTALFPEDRTEIERLLLLRPAPENRNWLAGETVAQLAAENAAHGIGV